MDLEATQFVGDKDGWRYTFNYNPYKSGWCVLVRRVEHAPIPPMTKMWTTEGWVHSLRKAGGEDVYFATVDEAIATITNPEDQ